MTLAEIDAAIAALQLERARLEPKYAIKDKYGLPLEKLVPPPRYEFTGEFRCAEPNEWFMGNCTLSAMQNKEETRWPSPRLILRRKPEPPPEPTVESVYGKSLAELEPLLNGHPPMMEGGKPVVREPQESEWFLGNDSKVLRSSITGLYGPRLILLPRRRLVANVIAENRAPKCGEWAESNLGNKGFVRANFDWPRSSRLILSEPNVEILDD